MERKIGEIFEHKGEWYQCVRGQSGEKCIGCSFKFSSICIYFHCLESERKDHTKAIFKKLEKIGEPFYRRWTLEGNNKLMQRYKTYTTPLITIDKQQIFYNLTDDLLEIEIKQTKEDMEEKKQCDDNRFEVIEKAKRHLLHSTNIESNKEEMKLLDVFLLRCWQMGWLDSYDDAKHSNSEKIGKNLKPFSLEAAKAGKPVCTRDGRKARIICFDAEGNKPLIVLSRING